MKIIFLDIDGVLNSIVLNHLVQTNPKVGLTTKDVNKAIKILRRKK